VRAEVGAVAESRATPGRALVDPTDARSWLLVPASRPERFAAAHSCGADAVVLDIEDAVAPTQKSAARDAVARHLDDAVGPGAWVRINDATTPWWSEDLEVLSELPGLRGVMLAKTESADQLEATRALLPTGTRVLALVESARGIEAAAQIAAAGAFRLAFGSGDFRRDTGAADTPLALAYARSRLVVASRAAGIPAPIDGPSLSDDEANVRTRALQGAELGMSGALCLLPEQTRVVNAALSPSATDIEWATDSIRSFEERGGAISDGSDLPRMARARAIRRRAEAFGLAPRDAGRQSSGAVVAARA
jgi:citrate lyase subunit beta/citryl-CoA lyase